MATYMTIDDEGHFHHDITVHDDGDPAALLDDVVAALRKRGFEQCGDCEEFWPSAEMQNGQCRKCANRARCGRTER